MIRHWCKPVTVSVFCFAATSTADANNALRLVYSSSLDPTHRQQQQQHVKSPATATSPPGGLPGPADSAASSVTIAASVPWLGLAGLSGLMQPGRVQDEVRVRMTQVALQMAELATQLVSVAGWCLLDVMPPCCDASLM